MNDEMEAVVCAAAETVGGTWPVTSSVSIVFMPFELYPDCTAIGSPGWFRRRGTMKSPSWKDSIEVTSVPCEPSCTLS